LSKPDPELKEGGAVPSGLASFGAKVAAFMKGVDPSCWILLSRAKWL
jgi:hypothetical protein